MNDRVVMLNSGYEMPILGLGTWTLTGETCEDAVYTALKDGYRLIDTAQYYGNEKNVGNGILTAAKKPTWRPETIKKILQNEKYIGDALLQKIYTVDVLTKKRVKNNGIMPQYYVENNHEAIIPRDLYMQVQEEILRRANLHSGADRKKRVYSSKYALSSICYCPRCGDIYQRIQNNKTASWKCATRVEKGPTACEAPLVPERELQNAVLRGINMVLSGRDNMMTKLKENIEQVLLEEDISAIEAIDAKLEDMQHELIKKANANQDYEDLADEIDNLREQRLSAMTEKAEREGLKKRIQEMKDFLENQTDRISEYDEMLVRKMIEKITIYDDKFVIEFKSGTSMDVRR